MLLKVSRSGNTGEHATKHGAGLGQTEDKEGQLRKSQRPSISVQTSRHLMRSQKLLVSLALGELLSIDTVLGRLPKNTSDTVPVLIALETASLSPGHVLHLLFQQLGEVVMGL